MTFELKNIDRALEWKILDTSKKLGIHPDKRAFLNPVDKPGYKAAKKALGENLLEVFGVGNFRDRSQLGVNNIIITRMNPEPSDVGTGHPFAWVLQADNTYTRKRTAESLHHIQYEFEYFCDNVDMERLISQMMLEAFGSRRFIFGINDDLTNMEDGFDIFGLGNPADTSGPGFIEKHWFYEVKDVQIEPDLDDAVGIPPITEMGVFVSPGADPDESADDWEGNPADNKKLSFTVPLTTIIQVNVGNPNRVLITFDQNIVVDDADGLPFSIKVDGVDKTDLVNPHQGTQSRIHLDYTTPFVTGTAITISYQRDQGGEIVQNLQKIEMEQLTDKVVTNNL